MQRRSSWKYFVSKRAFQHQFKYNTSRLEGRIKSVVAIQA
ncbi:protein of unassigned function [Methylobacterium oryzae CBMB20]|uniref:Protein of unassigned function n=1 Tax=Methylobacterium oryzae CBMB20 TaxID=693986 RepID=A0A089QA94_9HYPH|nr:protein of unassigned function [Methylobacterium oryzae CBMB20]